MSDDNTNPSPEPKSTDEPKPARCNVHYFQSECLHDPCLRCDPYCPYCGDKAEDAKLPPAFEVDQGSAKYLSSIL